MLDPERWLPARVTHRVAWDEGLFTVQLDMVRAFEPGQFVKLARWCEHGEAHRAYSIASAPDAPLEFFVVRVDGGLLSPCLDALRPGDEIHVGRSIVGGFTLAKIPEDDARTLWMVATGTGLAPFISMLRHGALWQRFDRAVLVQGARVPSQLAYRDELAALSRERPLTVLSNTTREPTPDGLFGRVTTLLDSGALEAAAGEAIAPGRSHVMLCGNPEMVDQLRHQLRDRGLELHTPRRHGAVHLEKYW
jgi:ferredoxin--NADP+ reductase